MEPERVDLEALDPTLDRVGYERLVRRVLDAAAPELARRSATHGPLALVAGWARPGLAAAAAIAAIALGALLFTDRTSAGEAVGGTVVEALGMPTPAAEWLSEGRSPTRADLVLAMERRP